MAVTVTTLTTTLELQAEVTAWRALHQADSQAPFFTQPEYLLAWWQHLAPAGAELRVMVVKNEVGQWQACWPLFFDPQSHRLQFLGGVDETDYLDVLIADTADQAAVSDLLLSGLKNQDVPQLFLPSLTENSHLLQLFLPALTALGWQVTKTAQTVCPVISLPQTVSEYEATLPSSLLKSLKQSAIQAGDDGEVTYQTITDPSQLSSHIKTFITLHQQSSTEKAIFWTPERTAFFETMMLAVATLGQLRLELLLIDNDPAAALLIFEYRQQFLLYNSGFNAFRYGHLRVGNLLVKHTVDQAISLDLRRYDFMRGDEAYKFQFGAVAEPVWDVTAIRQSA